MKLSLFIPLLFCLLYACSSSNKATFEIYAGDLDREAVPVKMIIPEPFHKATDLSLKNTESGNLVPVQRIASEEFCFLLDEPLKARQSRTYELSMGESGEKRKLALVKVKDGKLQVFAHNKPVLQYHMEEVMPPEGNPDYYRKSGFIHPIYTPGGQVITEGFPEGHMHQHGFFFAWTKTVFEGRTPDFWNQHQQTGRVEHESILDTVSGPVFAAFSTSLIHTDVSAPEGPKQVLDESWTLRVFALEEAFLFELESVHTCATDSPLLMPEYRYGGMGIRASSQWFEGEGAYQNQEAPNRQGIGQGGYFTSEGLGRIKGNHSRPEWVGMDGQIDGEAVGMVAMGHPENFRFPQPVRIHPSMPYFCFAPMVAGDFSIEAGEAYISRYRFLVFNGEPNTELIDQVWQDYRSPIEGKWTGKN